MRNQLPNPREPIMDTTKLLDCADQLGEMIAKFEAVQPTTNDTVQAMAHLTIAFSYVSELTAHLVAGMEPQAALQATARGDLKLGA